MSVTGLHNHRGASTQRTRRASMSLGRLARGPWRVVKPWVSTLWDAVPPFNLAEGPLTDKEIGDDGTCYIAVGSARVEVDRVTFEMLELGELIRVRYTRANRAINIDRFVSGTNSNSAG